MCTLREFEIHARGVTHLVAEWELRHAEVRKVWKIEDLIEVTLVAVNEASRLYTHFCQHARFPPSERGVHQKIDLAYFIQLLRQLLEAGKQIEDRVCVHESEGYVVRGGIELRGGIFELEGIMAASDAELSEQEAESLEWEELERRALPSERIDAIAAYLKSTGQASS